MYPSPDITPPDKWGIWPWWIVLSPLILLLVAWLILLADALVVRFILVMRIVNS